VQKTLVLGKREVDQLHYTSEKLPFMFCVLPRAVWQWPQSRHHWQRSDGSLRQTVQRILCPSCVSHVQMPCPQLEGDDRILLNHVHACKMFTPPTKLNV